MTSPALYRPEPVSHASSRPVDSSTPPRESAAKLLNGISLHIADSYGTGAGILIALNSLLPAPGPDAPYQVRQDYKHTYKQAARRLLAPIAHHRVDLPDAPFIGFFRDLYPRESSFYLAFVDVLDLRNAWHLYSDGVHMPVLGAKVHPFYGTYAPTRMTHLELFGTWLSQYDGPKARAVDVGCGCGVLAMQLCRAGFTRVLATDVNPSAAESVSRELRDHAPNLPIDVYCGDLLEGVGVPVDVIVFNPPWTRGDVDSPLDRALVYDDDSLFERFFEQASTRLSPNGRVVLVFSNLIRLVQPDVPHPIDAELERGRFRLVNKLHRKVKPTVGADGRRRKTREQVEVWELALA